MTMTEREYKQSGQSMEAIRQHGYAVAARYDRRRARVVVSLNTGTMVSRTIYALWQLAGTLFLGTILQRFAVFSDACC